MRNKTLSPFRVIVAWQAMVLKSGVVLYVPHYYVVV
jgi:hypothetical protein